MKIQIIATLACSALLSPAQVLNYSLLSSDGPSARFDGTLAYDPVGRRLFMFGGQDNAPRNDLWSYSLDQRRWTEIQPSGAKPPERFGHTLILDPVRRRLILFGARPEAFSATSGRTILLARAGASWSAMEPAQAVATATRQFTNRLVTAW